MPGALAIITCMRGRRRDHNTVRVAASLVETVRWEADHKQNASGELLRDLFLRQEAEFRGAVILTKHELSAKEMAYAQPRLGSRPLVNWCSARGRDCLPCLSDLMPSLAVEIARR